MQHLIGAAHVTTHATEEERAFMREAGLCQDREELNELLCEGADTEDWQIQVGFVSDRTLLYNHRFGLPYYSTSGTPEQDLIETGTTHWTILPTSDPDYDFSA